MLLPTICNIFCSVHMMHTVGIQLVIVWSRVNVMQTQEILSDITGERMHSRALMCNKILWCNCSSGITARHGGNQAESDRERDLRNAGV